MNDRDRNHDQTSEDAFFDFGDRVAFGEGQAPRTELEETFMRIQDAFRQPVAASAPTRSRKDTIWASVMAAPATAALPASGPATERSWSRPLPPGRENSKRGRWSFSQFAANATLALLIALVGFVSWKGLYGGTGSNQPGEASTIPAAALQIASPPAATPEGSVADIPAITSCDLSGDIPIVTQLSEGTSPLPQTAIYLTQHDSTGVDRRGTLSIGCADEERTALAEDVVSVSGGPWPGIVSIAVVPPDDLNKWQLGYVDVATGQTLIFAPSDGFEYRTDSFRVDGSPWVAGRSLDDPSVVLLADLRTFETRPIADVLGMPLSGVPLIISEPSDEGTLAIGFAHRGSFGADGSVYLSDVGGAEAPDSILVLGASFDDTEVITSPPSLPFSSPLGVSPDGSALAVVSAAETEEDNYPESYTYGVISLPNGGVIATSDVIPSASSPTPAILWVQSGASAVYLAGTTVQKLEVGGSGSPETVLDAGENLTSVKTTWNPDVIVAIGREDHGSDADPDQTAEDVIYSIDLVTGQTHEFPGMDASSVVTWITTAGALVMFEWQDTPPDLTTYTVFDPVSGMQIGEIPDGPSQQSEPGQRVVIGPDSVSASADGRVEVMSLGTQHIYVFTVENDVMSMTHLPAPEGLLSEIPLIANVYLSPDGSQLSLTGEGDEGRTRYLIDLTDPDSGWIEIPSSGVGGPGPIGFMPGPTR
ncbi:MAG: hypothetical protein KF883_12085 [Thermomicrobiales bacterium]|nr:hypothetical protein [Thermomicrobiales bacterium]